MSEWIVNGICPACGHCGMGGECINCADRGRVAPQMVSRTREHAEFGVPTPLFFFTPDGVDRS